MTPLFPRPSSQLLWGVLLLSYAGVSSIWGADSPFSVLEQKALDSNITVSFEGIPSICGCRMQCVVLGTRCQVASATELDSGLYRCDIADGTVFALQLVNKTESVTFYRKGAVVPEAGSDPEYQLVQERYYKVVPSATFDDAIKTCYQDGGFLATMETQDKRDEVTKFMTLSGTTNAWIAGFGNRTSNGSIEPPTWWHRSGQGVALTYDNFDPSLLPVRCFHATLAGGALIVSNVGVACGSAIPAVCQRDD